MKVGTYGLYVVSAMAIRQGTMWTGTYTVRKHDRTYLTTSILLEQTHTEGTFATKAEAEEAAFSEGEAVVLKKRRGGIST